MDDKASQFFANYFENLTGRRPYPWQRKLFLELVGSASGRWPEVVDLPTGAGKTSVVYIWLLGYSWCRQTGSPGFPRRLVWIVNRRVVVDQVTSELEQLCRRPEVDELLGSKLALSTLRGQLADNGDWSRDPSRPAVVVGTVDLIGSRLLFRGYRAGGYYRPVHAGLLGVDALIVNDEAHLSPALARLLKSIHERQPAQHIRGKSFRFLLLSATQDGTKDLARFGHDIEEDAQENQHFARIFRAPKKLVLQAVPGANELRAAMWRLATEAPASRTAIFIEQPEKALEFLERLRKEGRACKLLTGTMRGFERDELVKSDVFRRFLIAEPGTDPVWLVATSAGEVGVNFSCDRLITGLTEADGILQRFGRLNRFGESEGAEAHLVFRKPSDKEPRLQATLAYLDGLGGDASCANLWYRRAPEEALTEKPALARFEDRLVDIWSQTTYPDRHLPPVASWLHGKEDPRAPETEIVWRSDVELLASGNIGGDQIAGILEYYPVRAREKVREPAYRVADKLTKISEQIAESGEADPRLIIIDSDGTAEVAGLAELARNIARDESYLDYKMLLLPGTVGSLSDGMFSIARRKADAETEDVADSVAGGVYDRVRFVFVDGVPRRLATKENGNDPGAPTSHRRADLRDFTEKGYRPALVVPLEPDDDSEMLVYFGALSQRSGHKPVDVPLYEHLSDVAARAGKVVRDAGLELFAEAFERAGGMHDSGKARAVWQRAMGGSMEKPLGKTRQPVNLKLIGGYRHELGSLLDCRDQADDLVLHLIASHHKAARPCFEPRHYDRQNITASAEESIEAARRYARLQQRYGPWGLAYLESLFKCADGMVSAEEGDGASG